MLLRGHYALKFNSAAATPKNSPEKQPHVTLPTRAGEGYAVYPGLVQSSNVFGVGEEYSEPIVHPDVAEPTHPTEGIQSDLLSVLKPVYTQAEYDILKPQIDARLFVPLATKSRNPNEPARPPSDVHVYPILLQKVDNDIFIPVYLIKGQFIPVFPFARQEQMSTGHSLRGRTPRPVFLAGPKVDTSKQVLMRAMY